MSYTEREPRRSVELEVQMKDFSFIKTTDESSMNLSPGGAFIRMDEPYPSGTLVKFKMVTPDKGVIDGVGKVAWLREKNGATGDPAGVGIKFLKMSDQSRALLDKVLESAEVIVSDYSSVPPEKTDSIQAESGVKTSVAPEKSELKSSVAPGKSELKSSVVPGKSELKSSVAPGKSELKSSVAPGKSELKSSVAPEKSNIGSSVSPAKRESGISVPPQPPAKAETKPSVPPLPLGKRASSIPPAPGSSVLDLLPKTGPKPETKTESKPAPAPEAKPEFVSQKPTALYIQPIIDPAILARADLAMSSSPPPAPEEPSLASEPSAPSESPESTANGFGVSARAPSPPISAPKPSASAWIIGIGVVVAVILGAWLLLGKGENPPPSDKEDVSSVSKPEPAPKEPPKEAEPAAAPKEEPAPAASPSGDEAASASAAANPSENAPAATPAAAPDEPTQAAQAAADQAAPPADQAAAPADQAAPPAEPAPAAAPVETVPVEVTTNPPGATILVNGQAQEGVTPLTVNVEKDKESELTAKLFGYVAQSIQVTGTEEVKPVALSFKRARLRFSFSSTPSGARIIIDGKFNGTTPYTFLRTRYKPEFQYKLEKKGYQSVEGVITESDWTEEGRFLLYSQSTDLSPK